MKQKILIFWNPEWIYQIDTFIENNCYIDIVVLSTEHTVSKKIQQHVNQVYYYAGPKWNERLEEDGVNIINLVNEIFSKNRYDFVFPDWLDRDIEFFATINERAKIPGIKDYKSIYGKHRYYEIFNKLSIPTPLIFIDSHHYPLIYKPSYGTGGQGIYICNSKEELRKVLNTRNEHYVLQQYINGTTFCVVGHVHQFTVNIDLIYDIEITSPPFCAEIGFVFPSKFSHLEFKIKKFIQSFVDYINLNNSPFMFDLIIDADENFFFIDFSPRIATSIHDLMYYIDNKDYFYNITNKILNDIDFTLKKTKCFVKKMFLMDNYSDKKFRYILNDGIKELQLLTNKDQLIKDDVDVEYNTGHVIATSDNLDSCYKTLENFLDINSIEHFKFFD
jgi:hypothetical protein